MKKNLRRILAMIVAMLVLGAAPAQAAPTTDEAVTPHIGQIAFPNGDDLGYRMLYTSDGGTSIISQPNLFEVKSEQIDFYRAYCLEIFYNPAFVRPIVTGWDGYRGTNAFTDPKVQRKVAWIVQNSFPTTSLSALAAKAGVSRLTRAEAITATQSAIWTLTDNVKPHFDAMTYGYGRPAVSRSSASNVKKLYAYLLGEKNVGLGEKQLRAAIEITADGGEHVAGTLVGPIRISSTEDKVSIKIEGGFGLVDKNGTAIDENAVPTGIDLFVDARNTEDKGSVSLTGTASVATHFGAIMTPTSLHADHGQTLIVVREDSDRAVARAVISWGKKPVPTPTPTKTPEKPAPTPTPTKTPDKPVPTPTPTPTPTKTPEKPAPTQTETPQPAEKPGLARTGADTAALAFAAVSLLAGGLLLRRKWA
ncbi:thioester domain-containing protein [Trueperella pecoris]|uniref:Thioester domain-containing protein n=1 Tax=Trueperella pecoris TaxID=2733571 RepID=A0A7M1QUZ8_9ACTO|nr:thioester domain-containing protein [Trueperella pecoris]QOQ39616.1 Cys-Gln thioester bond-forming surface protein [Trueperella pecoris]QOR45758.1 thioester domain-containing protein [Trueperella pecoris]